MRFRRFGFGETRLYGAVMMGRDMDMLGRILGSDGGLKGNLYQVDETYEGTGKRLVGATITVYKPDGSVYFEGVTGADGSL